MTDVSVIVPVYNTAPYLRRCLDSLTAQTLNDIEILAVDDASTDGSAAILREYAEQDSRIRVVTHARNLGLHLARMTGVDAASGAYVGYVDSDDYVAPAMFERLHRLAIEHGADTVRGGARVYADVPGHDPAWTTDLQSARRVFASGVEYLNADFYPCMWMHLHRRALWAAALPHFPRMRLVGEDNLTAFILAHLSNTVVVSDALDYFYVERSDSLSGDQSLASALTHIDDRAAIVTVLETFTTAHGDAARPALNSVIASNRSLLQTFYISSLANGEERRAAQARFDERWGS